MRKSMLNRGIIASTIRYSLSSTIRKYKHHNYSNLNVLAHMMLLLLLQTKLIGISKDTENFEFIYIHKCVPNLTKPYFCFIFKLNIRNNLISFLPNCSLASTSSSVSFSSSFFPFFLFVFFLLLFSQILLAFHKKKRF